MTECSAVQRPGTRPLEVAFSLSISGITEANYPRGIGPLCGWDRF
jgi:hypothetical protein